MKNVPTAFAAIGGGIGLAALGASLQPAIAQQQGSLTTATIVSDVEWNDNYNLSVDSPGDALIWDTVLQLGMEERTPVDTFIAGFQGTLRVSDVPINGTDTQADNPILALDYDRQVDDSALTFGARYQRADLDFFDPLAYVNPDGSFDDTFGGGTRETLRANVGVDLNSQGPVSFLMAADVFEKNYYDTDDPNVNDSSNGTILADVGFRLTPTLQMILGAAYDRAKFTGTRDRDRRTAQADIGFNAQLNPRLDAAFRIGYSEVKVDRTTGTDTQTGTVGSFNIAAAQQNGQVNAGFVATLNENGMRYNATVGKLVNWPNASLNANIGATVSQDTEVRPIGDIVYSVNLPRSQISLGLRQFTSVNDDGDDTINTYADASFRHSITPVSAVSFVLAAGVLRYEDPLRNDTDRLNFTAVYTHSLTRDWGLNLGYRGRYRDQENTGEATSNAVFVGVQRDFASIR